MKMVYFTAQFRAEFINYRVQRQVAVYETTSLADPSEPQRLSNPRGLL